MADRRIRTVAIDTEKAIRQELPRLRAAVANLTRYGHSRKDIDAFVKTTVEETERKIAIEEEQKAKAEKALKDAKRSPRRS